jgi:hypothetical protein
MSDWLKKKGRRLFWKTLPRRTLCLVLGHRFEEAQPVIIDGPIDLPPREREWTVLAFHRQCARCWKVTGVSYTFDEAVDAVREAIEEDEIDPDDPDWGHLVDVGGEG